MNKCSKSKIQTLTNLTCLLQYKKKTKKQCVKRYQHYNVTFHVITSEFVAFALSVSINSLLKECDIKLLLFDFFLFNGTSTFVGYLMPKLFS